MDSNAFPDRSGKWLAVAFLAIACPACGPSLGPNRAPRPLLPDPQVARGALEKALEEWRTSPQIDAAAANGRSLIFVDHQRQPGQKLRRFEILSSSEVDNQWRFVVRLELTDPEETVLAPYYVFDRSPIWVYRGEDFDMMMNMDMAPETLPVPADPAETASASETQPEPRNAAVMNAEGHEGPQINRDKREK